MLNQQHPILNCIDPHIEPLIKRVLQTEKFGVCCGVIELNSVSSSCGKTKGDRLKLSIPYAKQNLIWNVLFDSQCPEIGPDFVFNDDTFLADPDIDTLTSHVPSLAKWNPNDGNALLNVLIELLHCYKQHQIQLIDKQGDRLQLEYSTLVGETDIRAEDVEVILLPMGFKPTEARFLISLSIDVPLLPICINQSKNNMAVLDVTFCGPAWNRIIPRLYLSKQLEEVFGGSANLHIPPFPPDKYLMDYIPEVKKFIMEKINALDQSFERRKDFIAALILLQRGSIIEYDAIDFSFITILLEHRDFYFLTHFYLSPAFPKEMPTIKMESIYHTTQQNKNYTEILQDGPYSPRWKSVHMVSKLLAHIMDVAVAKFQTNSMKNN